MENNQHIISPDDAILVTGANGFVGSKVVETLLTYGFKHVRCLTRQTGDSGKICATGMSLESKCLEVMTGNLLSQHTCLEAVDGIAVIYHLAAGVGKSYADCFLNSAVASRNLLDAAVKQETLKRFVNISSIAVYSNENIPRGGLLDESCQIETKPAERHEPYVYGKVKQDEMVLDYAAKYGLPYVIVRPSVVFGPGKAKITDRVGTDTFGLFLHLGMSNTIPLTFVDNCAEAIVLAGLKKGVEGEVFNIVDDDLPKSREFLRMYKSRVQNFISIPFPYPAFYLFNLLWEKYSKWSEGQLPPVFNRKSCSVYWKGNRYSNMKAKELLGWHPRVEMSVALERFFVYMRETRKKE